MFCSIDIGANDTSVPGVVGAILVLAPPAPQSEQYIIVRMIHRYGVQVKQVRSAFVYSKWSDVLQ